MLDNVQRLLKICDRLLSGGASHGFLAGLMKVFHRLFPQLAAGSVMCEKFDLFSESVRIKFFNRFHDTSMKRAAPPLNQASIGNLVGKGVLECVFEVGKQACLVNKFRRLKITQFPFEIFFR